MLASPTGAQTSVHLTQPGRPRPGSGQAGGLVFTLEQPAESFDVVGIVLRPMDQPSRVVDFESREGIDPNNEDNPDHGGVVLEPEKFIATTALYKLSLRYKSAQPGVTAYTVLLRRAMGKVIERTFTLPMP